MDEIQSMLPIKRIEGLQALNPYESELVDLAYGYKIKRANRNHFTNPKK